jgi:multiple sugar transport system ATP-binding protein
MDEPLTNLDFKLRVEMRSELKRIHSELNTTLSTSPTIRPRPCRWPTDRRAERRRLQQVGTPEEVYDHPLNRFVAGFIGNIRMNFLQCVLRNDDARR